MKHILQYFLPVSPFLTEIITDYVMIHIKGKPDWFNLKHRIGMIIGAVLILILLGFNTWQEIVKALALASLPFCFFDILLNKMRRIKWYHLGDKYWDKKLRLINPVALLVLRIIFAILLLTVILFVLLAS